MVHILKKTKVVNMAKLKNPFCLEQTLKEEKKEKENSWDGSIQVPPPRAPILSSN